MKALHDLFAGPILITEFEQATLAMIFAEVLEGKMPKYFTESKLQTKATYNTKGSFSGKKKLVIPMAGILLPDDVEYAGTVYKYGTKTMAAWLREAYADNSITEIEIRSNSPGGSTAAVQPMLDALAERNKPVYTVVDDILGSAAYWIAAHTDKITLTNRLNRVGSIGVMATLVDTSKMLERAGITIHTIYAEQSTKKNRDSEEALKGNYEAFQKSTLNPIAQAFIDDVKTARPQVKKDSTEGGVYYAAEAVERGLADELQASCKTDKPINTQTTNASEMNLKIIAMLSKFGSFTATKTDGTAKTEEDLVAELQAKIDAQDTQFATLNAEITRLKPFEASATQLTTDLATEKTAHEATKATLQEKEDKITELEATLSTSPAKPPITPTNTNKNKENVALDVTADDEKILATLAHNRTADGF